MINTEDESMLRLVVFGAALLAATMRAPVVDYEWEGLHPSVKDEIDLGAEPPPPTSVSVVREEVVLEARAIAECVVLEAQRLREKIT